MTEISIVVKATLVLATALAIASLLRGARASIRALLLASGFGVVLVLPAAAFLIPERAVQIPATYVNTFELVLERVEPAPVMPSGPLETNAAEGWHMPAVSTLARGVWVLGAAVLLLRMFVALWRVRTIRRTGASWLEGKGLAEVLAGTAFQRRVDVFIHEHVTAPMTFGVARPAIGLPPDATTWSGDALRHALLHEIEHVRRGDWLAIVASHLVCVLYWFNPLAWIASRRFCLEAERACDDAALRGAEQTAYAEQLVSLARRLSRRDPIVVLSMGARSDLSTRVRAVLDSHQARGPAGRLVTVAVISIAVTALLTISPLRAVEESLEGQTSGAGSQVKSTGLRFEVASVRPVPDAPAVRGFSGVEFLPGGIVRATRAPLFAVINRAYDLEWRQLEGGPHQGLLNERFAIDARADRSNLPAEGATLMETFRRQEPALREMLKTLLAERFKLAIHVEKRESPVYALVAGPNGHTLTAAARDCTPNPTTATEFSAGAEPRPCGTQGGGPANGLRYRGVELLALVGALTVFLDRPVIDRTGIAGTFDIDIPPWSTGALPQSPDATDEPQPDPNAPSLVTHLRERLGLRLESTRAPVDIYVVDRLERPSANDAPDRAPQAAAAPAFEVASIRRNVSADTGAEVKMQPGAQLTVTNYTLFNIVRNAYGVQPFQIVLGERAPAWFDRDRWNILAKAPADSDSEQPLMRLLQTLLADRFKLVVKRETRDMPVYALVVARTDGRLGPQIRPSNGDCEAARLAREKGGPQPPIGRGFCGTRAGNGSASTSGVPLAAFARNLAPMTGRFVIDKTGLAGSYDLDLKWNPDQTTTQPAGRPGDGASLFAALEEQLGLKLEPQRSPVEVLVVESAQRPVED